MTDYLTDPMSQPTVQSTLPPTPTPPPTPSSWQVPVPRPAQPISGPLPQLPALMPMPMPTPPAWPQLVPEPEKPRKNTALIIVTVVLFVAAALAGTLYITADRDRDTAVALLADNQKDLTNAKKQVTASADEKSQAEQDNTTLTDANTELRTCVEAVQAYLWDNLGEQESLDAVDRLWDACQ